MSTSFISTRMIISHVQDDNEVPKNGGKKSKKMLSTLKILKRRSKVRCKVLIKIDASRRCYTEYRRTAKMRIKRKKTIEKQ